jgi:lysophospholipase L1-like esterase
MKTFIAALLTAVAITACGGGGSGSISESAIVQKPIVTVMCIGDSETAGFVSEGTTSILRAEQSWPTQLKNYGFNTVNLGIEGSTTEEAYVSQYQSVLLTNPNIAILATGLNDVYKDQSIEESLKLYKEMIQTLKARGTKVYVLTPLRWAGLDSELDGYATELRKLPVEIIDLRKEQKPEWYCGNIDNHPCAVGYKQIAQIIASRIR